MFRSFFVVTSLLVLFFVHAQAQAAYNTGSYILYGDSNCGQAYTSGTVSLPNFEYEDNQNFSVSNCFQLSPQSADAASAYFKCSPFTVIMITYAEPYCSTDGLSFLSSTPDGSPCLQDADITAKLTCSNTNNRSSNGTSKQVELIRVLYIVMIVFLVSLLNFFG